MTSGGMLREIATTSVRTERESQRRYRQLLDQETRQAKMEAQQQAVHDVELFENQVERLRSVHKDSPGAWDWNGIYNNPPPLAPERSAAREGVAATALNNFVPGLLDRLLARTATKRRTLAHAVEAAKAEDEEVYQRLYQDFYQRYTEWDQLHQLAGQILQGETQAYADALLSFNPFADISELGASIDFKPHHARLVGIRLTADGERLVPSQMKSLTSTGKLSVKSMPKGRFFDTYLDFVCGVALRVGRELFAFLPVEMVVVDVQANLLNTRTGHQGIETILSVAMSRAVFAALNFERLDPSDAMENFPHRMNFRKTAGFDPVEPFSDQELFRFQDPERPARMRVKPKESMESTPREPVPSTAPGTDVSPHSPTWKAVPSASATMSLAELLSGHTPVGDCYWIPVSAIATLARCIRETEFTTRVCRQIAQTIEYAGYCIEPDCRFGGGTYHWDQLVAIFRPAEAERIMPSPAYHGAANLLRLCVIVAAADGTIHKHELNVFRQVIGSQLDLTLTELKRLVVLERCLAEDPSPASETLAAVVRAVSQEKRLLVGQVLVRVASVDHVITKDEYLALERVFKALELPAQALVDLVLQVCPSPDGVETQRVRRGFGVEAIAEQRVHEKRKEFTLDMSRVYAITNETKEVVGILSLVMAEEMDEAPPSSKATVLSTPQVLSTTQAPLNNDTQISERFTGLEAAFHPILERLLTQDSWPESEFRALANEFHLMPLNIHDVINEWADESLGDFLLEGEDPIIIRRELIVNERSQYD